MKISLLDILTLLAMIVGPIAAVQVQKTLERFRTDKDRKVAIFKTLMATRGSVLSSLHVEALNRIDLEFSRKKKYEAVIRAWKEYFDNLSRTVNNEEASVWFARNEELLANLLYEMGKALGYDFDKVLIKRNVYSPVGHSTIERENELLRKGMLDLLDGKRSLPFELVQDAAVIERNASLNEAMLAYFSRQDAQVSPEKKDG